MSFKEKPLRKSQRRGKAHKESSSRKHNQKAPEDMSFIREKTYTLPITLARGLRMRARTKKGKKRIRKEEPGGVLTHTRQNFPSLYP